MEFVSRTRIEAGWSADEKYCAVTADGTRYLERITPPGKKAEGRARLFEQVQKVVAMGVPMSAPVAFWQDERGAHTVWTWIDGQDAEAVIPSLGEAEQTAYGRQAGRILRKIHAVPAPKGWPDWEGRFNAKMDRKIEAYRACPIQFDGASALIDYMDQNRPLLRGRPQCLQHGDYHIGNMMIEKGALVIIDFDRYDFGDPWEEFNRIVWCAQAAPAFARGMVDGYFDGDLVPERFWRLLALYIASNTLSSIPWAIPFGQKEVDVMLRQVRDILDWYDGMTRIVPSWYGAP